MSSLKKYLLSPKTAWYRTTIVIAVTTAIAVFTISENANPIVYLRLTLSIIFVLFLPGFAFIKAVFPAKMKVKNSLENMDRIEQFALSFVMSLVLVALATLVLNYTPFGIRLTSMTLSLFALSVMFATVAVLREYQMRD